MSGGVICAKCGVSYMQGKRGNECPHNWIHRSPLPEAVGAFDVIPGHPDGYPGTDEGSHYMAQTAAGEPPPPMPQVPLDPISFGAQRIADERAYQIAKGYTAKSDQGYRENVLAEAAFRILAAVCGRDVPDDGTWVPLCVARMKQKYGNDKPKLLAIAGAFIAAEIDRLKLADDMAAAHKSMQTKNEMILHAVPDDVVRKLVRGIFGTKAKLEDFKTLPDAVAHAIELTTKRWGDSANLVLAVEELMDLIFHDSRWQTLPKLADAVKEATRILRNASEDARPFTADIMDMKRRIESLEAQAEADASYRREQNE